MPPRGDFPACPVQGVQHTGPTNLFVDIQVVRICILSPKVIQPYVRSWLHHPRCIHRMTNEGQTGEQKLKIFPNSAPLPPLRWGKNDRHSGRVKRIGRRGDTHRSRRLPVGWAKARSHIAWATEPWAIGALPSGYPTAFPDHPGTNRVDQAIATMRWTVHRSGSSARSSTTWDRYTVDRDRMGQEGWIAKGVRIRRGPNPLDRTPATDVGVKYLNLFGTQLHHSLLLPHLNA
jgi:hypothetical protein